MPHPHANPPTERAWIIPLLAALLLLAGCTLLEDDAPREATLTIDHPDAVDQEATQHTITYDPQDRPTMDLYEATGTDRPDAYTVHDLIADWSSQTGTPVTIEHSQTLGFQLESIDETPPEPDASYWALTIDGERETASIGTIPVEPDTEYRLTYTPLEDPDADAREATVVVDYNGFKSEDPQTTTHTVLYDPATRPTMDLYEDTDRPDAYTTHDLMADWSDLTGTNHTAQPHDEFGYVLESIGGITAHTTQGGSWSWDLFVDGQEETASLATVNVQPDTTYEWRFTHGSNQ